MKYCVNALYRAHVSARKNGCNCLAHRLHRCQCPMSGSRLCTLKNFDCTGKNALVCQCPMSGSRLCTWEELFSEKATELCQCPMSGSRLCTDLYWITNEDLDYSVSMPYVGLTSLHMYNSCELIHSTTVSMPYVGLTSLHVPFHNNPKPAIYGVNALCRAHVSAQYYCIDEDMVVRVACQCPMSGSRLCTDSIRVTPGMIAVCVNALCRAHVSAHLLGVTGFCALWLCQCPMSGSRLCTELIRTHKFMFSICVNALCRAHVSAPCPLKPLVFMRGSSPIFCVFI